MHITYRNAGFRRRSSQLFGLSVGPVAAASVQNPLFPETHDHDIVDEADEPGVVEKP